MPSTEWAGVQAKRRQWARSSHHLRLRANSDVWDRHLRQLLHRSVAGFQPHGFPRPVSDIVLCFQFARYLSEEIHATPSSQFTNSESSSDASDEEDDDDDGGWLARSSTFDLGQPLAVTHNQETASSAEFDDAFIPAGNLQSSGSSNLGFGDSFTGDDDDAFGPFSDAAAPSDPFTLSDPDDSPFDFGDFQAAEAPSDGEMTPTADSWTFDGSGSEGSGSLSGSALSFGGSSEEAQELRESLEAATLEDQENQAGRRREAHLREASLGQ